MGFYYEQPQGFYYDQPQGFYYNQQQEQNGFYYEQPKQQGFYYDQGFYYNQDQGFYYDQQQEGFYYEGFYYDQEGEGFYYDQRDDGHAKFNKENKDYWYKGAGRERVVKALNGLRTLVDAHVVKNPHAANDIQGQALSNVVCIQVVREVLKKFIRNVNPDEFFKNGGNEEQLATLLAKECQSILSPAVDFRGAWREDGSEAKKAMDKVSEEIVPFMVSWAAKQEFHKPNGIQDAACMKIVAKRLCEEAFYEYAKKTKSSVVSSDPEKQAKQIASIAKTVADGVLNVLQSEIHPKTAN